MKPENKIIRKFKRMCKQGDIEAIAEFADLNASTVSRILNERQATTLKTLTKISDYFKNKQKQLSEL